MSIRLDERAVKAARAPAKGAVSVWDDEITGCGLRVIAPTRRNPSRPRRNVDRTLGANMVTKAGIVEKLGERAVLLPALIEEGLAANDRLKIRLTMLQEAAAQASEPGRAAQSMERERRAVGLTDPIFNAAISGARRIDADTFLAPGAEALGAGIAVDLKAMMAPIEIAEAEAAPSLKARLDATLADLPGFKGDRVAHRQVAELDLAAARASRYAEPAEPVAKAGVASPGVACGHACFTSERANEVAARGEPAILVARFDHSEGCKLFSLIRASFVVRCHSAMA